jgi:hypothetical protein
MRQANAATGDQKKSQACLKNCTARGDCGRAGEGDFHPNKTELMHQSFCDQFKELVIDGCVLLSGSPWSWAVSPYELEASLIESTGRAMAARWVLACFLQSIHVYP